MRTGMSVFAAVLLLAVVASSSAQQPPLDPVVAMRGGKELFEKSCKFCHGLDRSLAMTRDEVVWGQIVKRMVAYGAPLNAAQRALVTRYLATRSAFAGRCAGCHELTRVVSDKPGERNWKSLTERMAGHIREFEKQGKVVAGGAVTPQELADIAALLRVVIP